MDGIGGAGEPAGSLRRQLQDVAAQCLGEQHFGHARRDDLAPGHPGFELVDGVADHAFE